MCQICTSGWQSWCTDVVLMIMELFSKVQANLISPKKKDYLLMIVYWKSYKENFNIYIQDAKFWAKSGFKQSSNSVFFRSKDKQRIVWCIQAWKNEGGWSYFDKVPCAHVLATPLNNKRKMHPNNNKRYGRNFLLFYEIVKNWLFLFTYQ